MILIIVLYMLLASTFTIAKAVLSYANPIFFIGIRMTIAGSLLLGYIYCFDKRLWRWRIQDQALLAQLTIFHIYVSFVFEFIGLQSVTSAKACLLYSLSPFLTALLCYYLFKQSLTNKQVLGLLIGISGMIPIMIDSAPLESISFGFLSAGELFLLGSVLSSSYGWILMKGLVHDRSYSPLMANGISMLSGGLCALVTSFIFEGMPALKGHSAVIAGVTFSPETLFLIYLALAIIIANFVFYNLYGYLLRRYSATFLSFAGLTTPLFAALYGWVFLGERVSYLFFSSVAIVSIGLALFYQDELKRQKTTHQ